MLKIFNSQKTTLGGDAIRLTISKIVTLCVSMITVMLLSRFRTLDEYGTYSQLLLVVSLFASIFMLGLPSSINYFLARTESKEEQQKFLSVFYTISTILSIIMGLALALSMPIIERYFNNSALREFVYFLAIYPWTYIISASIDNILIVYKKMNFLLIYRLINSLFLLASVIAIKIFNLGFSEYMICYLAVNILFAISVYIIVYQIVGKIKISFDFKILKAILIFSLPMGLATIVGTLDIEIDKLLIGKLMDTKQLAIYTNASKELPLTIIAASISAVLLPQVAILIRDKKNEQAIKLWNVATEISVIFMALFVAGIFTYAEDVINILYSGKYLAGVAVFRVYTLVLLLRVTYFGMILNALGKTKQIFWSSIIALGINAILNPLLFFAMGMVGPAIATFISIFVSAGWLLAATSKYAEVKFSKVFPWIEIIKILLINVLFAIVFYFVKKIIPLEQYIGSILESIILGGIWASLYILLFRKRIKSLWIKLNEKEVD